VKLPVKREGGVETGTKREGGRETEEKRQIYR